MLDVAGRWRGGIGAALAAVLAILLQLAIPPGFMVARTGTAAEIVICTGHGPLLAGPRDGSPAKAPAKSRPVCPFAGHGGLATAPPVAAVVGAPAVFGLQLSSTGADLLPGRGLAAPPPPSQGPPDSAI